MRDGGNHNAATEVRGPGSDRAPATIPSIIKQISSCLSELKGMQAVIGESLQRLVNPRPLAEVNNRDSEAKIAREPVSVEDHLLQVLRRLEEIQATANNHINTINGAV